MRQPFPLPPARCQNQIAAPYLGTADNYVRILVKLAFDLIGTWPLNLIGVFWLCNGARFRQKLERPSEIQPVQTVGEWTHNSWLHIGQFQGKLL